MRSLALLLLSALPSAAQTPLSEAVDRVARAALEKQQLVGLAAGVVLDGKVVRTDRKYADPHPFRSVVAALDTSKESPLVSRPGEKHSYTTHGYILLSAVVERAGKQPSASGEPTGYGLGFSVTAGKAVRVGHTGAQEKTRTAMLIEPAGRRWWS